MFYKSIFAICTIGIRTIETFNEGVLLTLGLNVTFFLFKFNLECGT